MAMHDMYRDQARSETLFAELSKNPKLTNTGSRKDIVAYQISNIN